MEALTGFLIVAVFIYGGVIYLKEWVQQAKAKESFTWRQYLGMAGVAFLFSVLTSGLGLIVVGLAIFFWVTYMPPENEE